MWKKYYCHAGLFMVVLAAFPFLSQCSNKMVFPGQSMINPGDRPVAKGNALKPFYRNFLVHGENLEGWERTVPGTPLVVYYGGNAEDVLYRASEMAGWGCSFLAVNYRGFGKSTGSPSQKRIVGDSLSLLDQAVLNGRVPWNNVVLLGQSIGSGVAVQVAFRRPVGKMVLLVPFDSLESVAKEKVPWLPVSWILDSPFRSDALASGIACPVHIYAALQDEVIPVAHARHLAGLFPHLACYRELDGISHMGLMKNPGFSTILRKTCLGK